MDPDDTLPVVETLLNHISAADQGSPGLLHLLSSQGASVADIRAVYRLGHSGQNSLDGTELETICRALKDVVARVSPPLITKKHVPKLRKRVLQAHRERTAAVTTLLTPLPERGESTTRIRRHELAAQLVARLLALLARVARRLDARPMEIARVWAPPLSLDAPTLQLLLILRSLRRPPCLRVSPSIIFVAPLAYTPDACAAVPQCECPVGVAPRKCCGDPPTRFSRRP
jgi:hypothetical protein